MAVMLVVLAGLCHSCANLRPTIWRLCWLCWFIPADPTCRKIVINSYDGYAGYAGYAGWCAIHAQTWDQPMTIMRIVLASSVALTTRYAANVITADYAGCLSQSSRTCDRQRQRCRLCWLCLQIMLLWRCGVSRMLTMLVMLVCFVRAQIWDRLR